MLLWLLTLFLLHVIIIISAVFYHKSNALELKVDSYIQIKFFTSKRIYVLFHLFFYLALYGVWSQCIYKQIEANKDTITLVTSAEQKRNICVPCEKSNLRPSR